MPVVHLPSSGVFLPTLLAWRPCICFPRIRTTDYHYLGSKLPKGQARTGPGAPVGCTELDAGQGQLHAGCSRRSPRGRQAVSKWLSDGNLAWQQGERWVYASESTGGYSCPCFTLRLPLMLCYGSGRLPQQFSGSIKLFSFLPPPQLVILRIALFADKVRRRYRPTSLELSSKVHIKTSGRLAIPALPENKTVNAEPLSVPGLLRAVSPPGRRSTSEVW